MIEEFEPDGPLTAEQREKVAVLSEAEIEAIDAALLSVASLNWQKVARIVGEAMFRLESRFVNIPDTYYAERASILVERGLLESFGDLTRMRYSEVRLPPY